MDRWVRHPFYDATALTILGRFLVLFLIAPSRWILDFALHSGRT